MFLSCGYRALWLQGSDACQCGQCNCMMTAIGERVHQQLDLITATVQVLRHIKTVSGCSQCEGQIKTAPTPPQMSGGGGGWPL